MPLCLSVVLGYYPRLDALSYTQLRGSELEAPIVVVLRVHGSDGEFARYDLAIVCN